MVNHHGECFDNADIRVGFESLDSSGKEGSVSEVVRFSDPDIFSACEFYAFVPLDKRAAGIGVIENDMCYFWFVLVLFDYLTAVIRRAVVQDNDFVIGICLIQYGLEPLRQERGMIIVWYNYRNFWFYCSFFV